MPQICKRTGRSHNDERLHIAGANDLLHSAGRSVLSEVMLLELMPISHLHAAASICSAPFDALPGRSVPCS